MEENNLVKKKKSNIIIPILIVVLIMGLTVFIMYEKTLKDNNKEETNKPVATPTPSPTTSSQKNTRGRELDDNLIINRSWDSSCEMGYIAYDDETSKEIITESKSKIISVELKEDKKTVILSVNWAEYNNSYGTKIKNQTTQDYTIVFDEKVKDVYVVGSGQKLENEFILYLMEDGTIEYNRLDILLNNYERINTDKKFKALGRKIITLLDIDKIVPGSSGCKNDKEWATTNFAITKEGKVYDIDKELRYYNGTASITSQNPVATPKPNKLTSDCDNCELKVDEEIKKIYNSIFDYFYDTSGYPEYKYHIKDKVFVNEISNSNKMELMIENMCEQGKDCQIEEKKFIDFYHQMFGKDEEYIYEDYMTGCSSMGKVDNMILLGYGECGDEAALRLFRYPYKAEKKNNDLYIYEKSAFHDDVDNKLYKDYDSAELIAENVDRNDMFAKGNTFGEYEDKVSIHKYTFKPNGDGTYYFYSVEKVK